MPTATASHGSICAFIGDNPYSVVFLPPERGNEAVLQIRLTRVGGKSYVVSVDANGFPSCECGDWIFRRHQIDKNGCKHLKFLRSTGLLHLRWRRPA